MALTKIKGFFKKYFTPTNVIIGLVVLSSLVIYTGFNTRAKLSKARSELASANVLNTVIEAEKFRLDSLIFGYKKSIAGRDSVITNRDKKISKQIANITVLENDLKNTLIDVSKVSVDSSYRYINQRIMPKSERKYPFDSIQIKTIHYTFLERDGLLETNLAYKYTTKDLLYDSSLKDVQIQDLKSLNSLYLSKEGILKKTNDAYTIQIEGLNKSVKQQKFIKTLLLPPAAIGVAVVVIKLLAK